MPCHPTLTRNLGVVGVHEYTTRRRRIDFAAGLHWLRDRRKAGATACRTFNLSRLRGWLFHLNVSGRSVGGLFHVRLGIVTGSARPCGAFRIWQMQRPSSNAPPLQRGPVAHIAEHFTTAGKKLLAVHAKWIGRYDRRGVKLQHGSVLFIWAMRALRRRDGAG